MSQVAKSIFVFFARAAVIASLTLGPDYERKMEMAREAVGRRLWKKTEPTDKGNAKGEVKWTL